VTAEEVNAEKTEGALDKLNKTAIDPGLKTHSAVDKIIKEQRKQRRKK
jgi:hypothetical protein